MSTDFVEARDALADAYGRVDEIVGPLAEPELLRSTRCLGWTVADLLFHLLLDAQRALLALATPADAPADTDAVTYWRGYQPGDGLAHALYVRRSAAAFQSPTTLVRLWSETARAVVRAAAAAPPGGRVATQGKVLAVPDFLATLVVEAAVHHLDLVAHLPGAPDPGAGPLALARRTLDGLLGAPVSADWDDATYALKGTGRLPLSAEERATLGVLTDRFPLFG